MCFCFGSGRNDDLDEGLGGFAGDGQPVAGARLGPAEKVIPVTRTSGFWS